MGYELLSTTGSGDEDLVLFGENEFKVSVIRFFLFSKKVIK